MLTASSLGVLSDPMGAIKNGAMLDAMTSASRHVKASKVARTEALYAAAQSAHPIADEDPYAPYP